MVAALPPSPASLTAERLLQAASDASVVIVRDARGLAHRVGTAAGHPIPLPEAADATAPADEQALAHLDRVGALFGLKDVSLELRLLPQALAPDATGDRIVKFQQVRDGLPVLGGELVVVLDSAGALRSVLGETLPGSAGKAPVTAVTAERAAATAVAVTARAHPAYPAEALQASAPERWYLDPALIGVPAQAHMPAGPVWRTEVTGPADVRELVLVDSTTGTVPLQLNQIAHALNQVVCDRANKPDRLATGSDCKKPYARVANSGPGGTETDQAWDNTVRTSKFFDSYLGIDLTKLLGVDTGDGTKLRSTVRFCPGTTLCSVSAGTIFDNAFWNGRGMYYGNGWQRADDVVAHELGHGLTDKTSRLLYLYQSGAINESMSDVIGELTDLTDGFDAGGIQTDWIVGEDAPLDDFLRSMSDPTQLLEPDRMTSALYKIDLLFQDSGAVHTNSGVGNKAAYLIAAGTGGESTGSFNGQTITRIGLTKTARLYLRAQQMLTSGADYADLAGVLTQSCADLVGKYGFATTTCASVQKAVAATEMTSQPVVPSAAAPEVGYCPTGTSRDTILFDGFEAAVAGRWTYGGQWVRIRDYAKEGDYSVYGVEPDYTTSSSISLNTAYPIPRGARTFLRFAHQYRLDSGVVFDKTDVELPIGLGPYYDGARLEYQVRGGPWTSATGQDWQNGPNKKITPEGGGSYYAFGGDSSGYVSSIVELTELVGKTVKLRWRIFGDKQIAFDGWTVDDVRLFACGGTKPSNLSALTVTPGTKKLTVTWKAPLYAGSGVTGYRVDRTGKAAVILPASARSYTYSGLGSGKSYTVDVNPITKGGSGPISTRTVQAK